jgi:hypothetical protein
MNDRRVRKALLALVLLGCPTGALKTTTCTAFIR